METYGRYQLLAKLATGGMAQVFLARQSGLEGFEKLVVLKRILPHLAENDEFVRMFLQEARVAARLNHPNIAQIYDLGKVGESFFIAMEYVHGEDFRRVVRQAGKEGRTLPVPLAVRMVIGACEGLEFAHNKTDESGRPLGIVHRDISPQNLLVTFEGGVKVIDFGIAKAADSATHTRTGVLKGKYSYMSPEQAEGKRVDKRSDVFALGIVLYELVTQTRLFKRQSDLATIQAVMACKFKRPSELNPAIDSDLESILLRVLAKDRDQRTPSAGQLQLELEEYLLKHRLPGATAHLKQFMRDVYAERLQAEARLGRPWYEEELAPSGQKPTPSGNASFEFDRPAARPPPPPPLPDDGEGTKDGRGSKGNLTPVLPRPESANDVVLATAPRRTAAAAAPPPLSPTVQDGDLSAVSRVVRQVRARRALATTLILLLLVLGGAAAAVAFLHPGAAKAERHASLRIQSDPPGADLFIDGAPAGQETPARVEVDPSRAHEIRVEKSGFAPAGETVPPFTGELARSFTLAPRAVGAVSLSTTPPGASVVLDGHTIDRQTPTILSDLDPARDHEIVLSLAGYEDEVVSVSVKPGRTTSVAKALRARAKVAAHPAEGPAEKDAATERPKEREKEKDSAPADGSLEIVTSPAGIAVEVDGRAAGKSPQTLHVAAGRHEVHFVDPDRFLDQTATVTVGAGASERVERTFALHKVRFNVTPFAEVYIKDRKFADSPGDAELYPGSYRVTYSCPDLKARHTETLVVPPDGGLVKVNLALKEGEGWE